MATKVVDNDNVGVLDQKVYRITNLAANDVSDNIFIPSGVGAVRAYGYGTTFTIDIYGAPTDKPQRLTKLGSVTNAVSTVQIPGPVGVYLQVRCVSVSGGTGTCDAFLVVEG